MPPIVDKEKCVMCGACIDVCNYDVYFGSKEGEVPVAAYPEECWHCNACVLDCPVEAIRLRIPFTAALLYK